MIRGERRGCVKLKNAQMGINDEDDSTFTITVDSKVFHFQGKLDVSGLARPNALNLYLLSIVFLPIYEITVFQYARL